MAPVPLMLTPSVTVPCTMKTPKCAASVTAAASAQGGPSPSGHRTTWGRDRFLQQPSEHPTAVTPVRASDARSSATGNDSQDHLEESLPVRAAFTNSDLEPLAFTLATQAIFRVAFANSFLTEWHRQRVLSTTLRWWRRRCALTRKRQPDRHSLGVTVPCGDRSQELPTVRAGVELEKDSVASSDCNSDQSSECWVVPAGWTPVPIYQCQCDKVSTPSRKTRESTGMASCSSSRRCQCFPLAANSARLFAPSFLSPNGHTLVTKAPRNVRHAEVAARARAQVRSTKAEAISAIRVYLTRRTALQALTGWRTRPKNDHR